MLRLSSVKVDNSESETFHIFSYLWGVSILFHIASQDLWTRSLPDALLACSAFLVVLDPTSLSKFLLMLVFQLLELFQALPRVANHWLFLSFVNLTILIAFMRLFVRSKGVVKKSELYNSFAPSVRIELLLLYCFATFHKLNRDFFVLDSSCAVFHYGQIAERFPFLPTSTWVQYFVIYFSLAIEAAIPILLVFRKFRAAGIVVAVIFHYLLGLSPGKYYNFAGMLIACYSLFAPDNFPALLKNRIVILSEKSHIFPMLSTHAFRVIPLGLALVGILAAATHLFWTESRFLSRLLWIFPLFLWAGYGLLILATYLIAVYKQKLEWKHQKELFVPVSISLATVPVLVLLNGVSPYLGLKTETCFSMFSNLRTEGKNTNHFLIPKNLGLLDYQNDLVTILDSSDPRLRRYADLRYYITFFELRSYVSKHPEISLAYLRNGKKSIHSRAGDDPELSKGPPLLLRKLLWYRPVDMDPRFGCTH